MIFGQIEAAMIARIDGASKLGVLGYTIRKVDTLPTDLDERLPTYVQDFPAAWTVFGGWPSAENMSGGEAIVSAQFHVVVGASSLRNEKAQRLGDGVGGAGSYQMAMDVIGLLLGQDFGLPIGGLQLGGCNPLYTGQTQDKRKVSLFAVQFTSRLAFNPTAPDVLTVPPIADFTSFAVAWDRPAGDPVEVSDLVTLPQES